MKVKLFAKKHPFWNRDKIEDEINSWLAVNKGIEIVEIKKVVLDPFAGSASIYISIWYEDEK